MTIEELKSEAAKLPPNDRFALAEWIERNEDIRELRHAALVREIEVGLDQLDRGESVECKDDAELRSFFDGVKARGREMLGARKNSAARASIASRVSRRVTLMKSGATSVHSMCVLQTAGSMRSSGDSRFSQKSLMLGNHAPTSPRNSVFYQWVITSSSTGQSRMAWRSRG